MNRESISALLLDAIDLKNTLKGQRTHGYAVDAEDEEEIPVLMLARQHGGTMNSDNVGELLENIITTLEASAVIDRLRYYNEAKAHVQGLDEE